MLALGFGFIAAFCWHENRTPQPMMPLYLWKFRTFVVGNAVAFVVYGVLGAIPFLLILTLQRAYGYSAFEAGLANLPTTVMLLLFAAFTGKLVARFGGRAVVTIGCLLASAGPVPAAAQRPRPLVLDRPVPRHRRVGRRHGAADRAARDGHPRRPAEGAQRHRRRCVRLVRPDLRPHRRRRAPAARRLLDQSDLRRRRRRSTRSTAPSSSAASRCSVAAVIAVVGLPVVGRPDEGGHRDRLADAAPEVTATH